MTDGRIIIEWYDALSAHLGTLKGQTATLPVVAEIFDEVAAIRAAAKAHLETLGEGSSWCETQEFLNVLQLLTRIKREFLRYQRSLGVE
jgi:hypothetical protein